MSDLWGTFKEFDITTRKEVSSFKVNNAVKCIVTYDNKSLIIVSNTSDLKVDQKIIKRSIRSKKQLHIGNMPNVGLIYSMSCSYDNKY